MRLCGVCDMSKFVIGDTVKFDFGLSREIQTGKVLNISKDSLSIYYSDGTGAYTIAVPFGAIIAVDNEKPKLEDIKKPDRYNKRGKLECWDVILDQEMDFLEGSVLKYLWRYKEKNGIHDLEKAKIYIDKIIQGLQK